jgi:hypothetical protein
MSNLTGRIQRIERDPALLRLLRGQDGPPVPEWCTPLVWDRIAELVVAAGCRLAFATSWREHQHSDPVTAQHIDESEAIRQRLATILDRALTCRTASAAIRSVESALAALPPDDGPE